MMLTIAENQKNDVLVLALHGRLDVATSPQLGTRLQGAFDGGNRRVVIDLAELEYVSSAGLRVLLAGLDRLEKAKGRLVLCRPSGYTQEVLEVAGMETVFPIAPTVEGAEIAARADG